MDGEQGPGSDPCSRDDLFALPHHMTGVYSRNSTFLADDEYGRALDTLVKGCADVILRDTNTGEILLMRRKVHPQPDWWFLGGRMRAGDTPQQAAAKNVRRETGLDITPSRFRAVTHASYLWQYRKQEPAGNGTADIAVVLSAQIAPQERAAIVFDKEEYEDMGWSDPHSVVDSEKYHPALRRATLHLLMRDVWDQLTGAVAAEASQQQQPTTKGEVGLGTNGQASSQDTQIAGLARQLVSMQALGLSLHRDAPASP